MTVHHPIIPYWVCRACSSETTVVPWPCDPRRKEMLAEYGGANTSLFIYLSTSLLHAQLDLPDMDREQLYYQIVGWLHRHKAGR